MNRFAAAARGLARLVVLFLLCAALCAAFAFSAAALGARGLDAFSSPAAAGYVAREALSGESETLRESLLSMEEFQTAAADYSRALAAWRFENGDEWQGLSDETSESIARALVVQSLSQENTSAAGIVGRTDAAAVEELLSPLQTALKGVLPQFSSIMQGEFSQRIDGFGTVVSGRAAMFAVGACALLVALHFLLYRDGRERLLIFAVALLAATIGCVIVRAVGKLPLLSSAASTRMGWFLLLFGAVSFVGTMVFVRIAVPFVKDFAKGKFETEDAESAEKAAQILPGAARAETDEEVSEEVLKETAAEPVSELENADREIEADNEVGFVTEEEAEEETEAIAPAREEISGGEGAEEATLIEGEAEGAESEEVSAQEEIEAGAEEVEKVPAQESDEAVETAEEIEDSPVQDAGEAAEEVEEVSGQEPQETNEPTQPARTYSAAPGSAALAADRDFDDGSFFDQK